MSPTMHSAISWTRANLMHLRTNTLWAVCADKWLLPMSELLSTCLCPLWGQWWSETSQPCGTCGLIHSLVSAPSCTPSRSEVPSEGKHKGHKKNMSRSPQNFFSVFKDMTLRYRSSSGDRFTEQTLSSTFVLFSKFLSKQFKICYQVQEVGWKCL